MRYVSTRKNKDTPQDHTQSLRYLGPLTIQILNQHTTQILMLKNLAISQ